MIQPIVSKCIVLSALLCALSGCGQRTVSAVVHGSVKMNGQPLANAEVRLVPKGDPNLATHAVTTDQAGNFTIEGKSASDRPVQAGSYVVLVSKLASEGGASGGMGMKNIVPPLYSDQNRSPLKAEIQNGDNNLPAYELVGSPKR